MQHWQDTGIVLSAKPHGENGAVASILTENYGRHAGYVNGARSSKMRGTLEPGNLVDVIWTARAEGNLGFYALELRENAAASFMSDALRLTALQSACALCDAALPEREGHPGLFHGLKALLATLESDVWGQAYVAWEIAFLRELGFSLDLSKCAGGGDAKDLTYVSPKTGRAVSRAAGEIYKEKLLTLPDFLKPFSSVANKAADLTGEDGMDDVISGLKLTEYFLEHWAFAHHTRGLPEPRLRLRERLERKGSSLSRDMPSQVSGQ